MADSPNRRPVALQRTDDFVGRTANWLYDHLRFVPRHSPVIMCDKLVNRSEFPVLEAWSLNHRSIARRVWHRVAGDRVYPVDRWKCRSYRPRVFHSHYGYVSVEAIPLQRSLSVPWFVSFYGADVYQLGRLPEWQEKYGRIFDECFRVLALGPSMAAALHKLGCPSSKLEVHPLGVDVDRMPHAPRELMTDQPLRVVFAGTFREKKGLQYLVQAAAMARRSGVSLELHLVGDALAKPGDSETKAEVFGLISRLGLEDIVVHHSWLRFEELISLSMRCQVFVAPSVTAADGDAEGTPFVLQQMMATEMAVIATVHSDIPHLFGKCADLLVPERDAGAIAERLELYTADLSTLATHGSMVRRQMEQHHNVRECAKQLSDLYDACVPTE